MTIFEAKGVSMQLADGRWLFRDVDIALNKQDVLVLRGPSGAGKTTLLKCLAELVPFASGELYLHDKRPSDYGIPGWRSRVMYVPQRPAVHPGTPLDLFNMVKKFKNQRDKRFDDPIQIGMDWNLSQSHFHEKWSNLSGGEMQRCALAVALALNPEVLLLDEPTSALDPESTLLVEETLKSRTCIWITHSNEQESRVATKSLVLNRQTASSESVKDDDVSGTTATEIDMNI
ncbi:P-loop containing nucleoside triphosphate hydrolase protein [Radiomyces spectabilis]|uniref:P-loop containing nucleoside triphosphate hydrolase protein n=1 Tax=Radiomyces spectabilis TaxID=64574 RepID=UPI00221F7B15|nr:P-loop containing nucleoside triphosphate hydrolase protein [Radiomyces spectabilis]KAI8377782.1 P-loop containing nucleoside triphosphate hydrolase protein [Radiomyces spectabilis]